MVNEPWERMITDQQRKLFNSACGDLSRQLIWHGGIRLSKDDYRHMIAGTILGWRTMPGIDRGGGQQGWIMLGGSSLDLRKEECIDAITLAFFLGDHPEEQHLSCKPVNWCDVVRLARGIRDADDELARRYAA